jgi:phosphoglycolate phosphatase
MRFSLLVFDWDGTLMDSEMRIVSCIKASITDLGLPVLATAAIRDIIGLGLREAINRLYPDSAETVHTRLAERYRYHFLSDNHASSSLFPGAKDMLTVLNEQGYLLAVATGKGRHGLDHVLEETGCKQLFHASRCADESMSKPHPQMLLEIMQGLNVQPSDTLMIGDTEYDMQMASNAGTAALAVSHGVHPRERLLQCNPLGCLADIAELTVWLTTDYSKVINQ